MSLIYRLILLLVICASASVAWGTTKSDCKAILIPQQTKLIKMAIEEPVKLYFELYDRDLKHFAETGTHDFPVSDLFDEDMHALREKLVWTQKYFQLRNSKIAFEAAQKLFARANKMRREGYGFLSYFEFSNACLHLFEIMAQERLYQTEDLPGYPLVTEYVEFDKEGSEFTPNQESLNYISAHLQRAGKSFEPETLKFAIHSYHQFPLYSLPSTSDVDRMELTMATSAPLSIRRIATYTESVDGTRYPPLMNAAHDDGHITGGTEVIPSNKVVRRFANREELRTHLLEKQSVTRHIIQKIKKIEDPTEQLLFDRMVFTKTHENRVYASIEYFGANYYGALLLEKRRPFEIKAGVNFLDIEIYKVIALESPEVLLQVYKTIQQWYVEGGGPKHPALGGSR